MIRHILIPTDGTPFSNNAARVGLRLAKALGARVTGLHVIAPFHSFTYRSQVMLNYHRSLSEDSEEAYDETTKKCAMDILRDFEGTAEEEGVRCDSLFVRDDQTFRAIVKAAKDRHCDLIAMASHGRGGISGVLLGNEAQKVLTHSHLPVLILN